MLTGKVTGYRGSVTVGGTELSDLAQHSLSRQVTYVGHAAYLFKGTVRDNLRMAAPDAGDGALWAALERARLADFLREGQGLDTLLTERGANLSGGQRQRLALARALLHDSPIYIFDESTSNIDPDSEAEILAAVRALAREKAVLFISHRLANVAHAQRIYVMEDGRVAAQGTHRELLRAGGTYERLWNTQKNLEEFGSETVAWKQPEPAAI
ncbi:putative multidrug export ATP-binding/permease protein [bioreactor metagenome]|uniref:Putative multidrug export ATP-binding/permease protein n=1 Tax=bioreactor metagenome TaxID=1076179 RepID=A0A645DF93_9ZZZZ